MKTEFVVADGTDDQWGADCSESVVSSIFAERDREALHDTHLWGCVHPWDHDREDETVQRKKRGLRHARCGQTLAGTSRVA